MQDPRPADDEMLTEPDYRRQPKQKDRKTPSEGVAEAELSELPKVEGYFFHQTIEPPQQTDREALF